MSSRRDLIITLLLVVAFTVFVVALAVLPVAAATAAPAEAPAAPAAVTEPATRSSSPGLLGGDGALLVGAAAVFGALAMTAHAVLRPEGPSLPETHRPPTAAQALLARRRAAIGRTPPRIGELAGHASAVVDRTLARRGWNDRIDAALEHAGLELRPGELCVLVAAAAGVASIAGLALGGPLLGLLLAATVVVAARLALSIRRDRRRARFADQLGDLLQLLSASLRAGHGILQAVEGAARDAESPTSDELRRLTTEIRLGRDFVAALDAVADRMRNEDFRWVVGAIRIHREVGGDLSQVLDRVGETIRSRARLHRQVRTLSAEGRMSAYVLLALPVAMAGFLAVSNPAYLRPLLSTSIGVAMLATAGVLLGVGAVWLRALTRLDL